MKAKTFQSHLLKWFDQHGRKHLPWQIDKTVYRVWISEIMLQQTQVTTVIPYFNQFIKKFPNLKKLAQADEEEILHLWSGLGYYHRARHLHTTAKIIYEQYKGVFPDNINDIQALPGIGRSTAGAILSIAFNQSTPILDGNVKRVLSRIKGINDPIDDKKIENELWKWATYYTPKNRIADYTQAMMDFGSIVCTRKKPLCETCPITKNCLAHQKKLVHIIPQKKSSRELPIRHATFIIIKNKDLVLLYKRSAKGVWGGLWSLPEISGDFDKKLIHLFCKKHFTQTNLSYQLLKKFKHRFSHYELNLIPILIHTNKKIINSIGEYGQIWYNLNNPQEIGLPKPIKTILSNMI